MKRAARQNVLAGVSSEDESIRSQGEVSLAWGEPEEVL